MLILKNCNIINEKGIIKKGNIGIENDKIKFVNYLNNSINKNNNINNANNTVNNTIDLEGKIVSPMFIDGHIHIESSHLTPLEFEKYALKYGVSNVVMDPHEIANVLGVRGIEYMLNSGNLLNFNCMIPSCVPATNLETNGYNITTKEIEQLFINDKKNKYKNKILGLGEVMDYYGIINNNENIISKIEIAKKYNKLIDGHAPQLTGELLEKYVNVGIQSDHECTTESEVLEKLNLGLKIMIREGTASKDIHLLSVIKKLKKEGTYNKVFKNIMIVSDDICIKDLKEGYLIKTLKKALKYVSPLEALQMITFNPDNYFNIGISIKSGNYANLIIFDNLEQFKINNIIIKGQFFNNINNINNINNKNKLNNIEYFKKSINYNYKTEKDFIINGIDNNKNNTNNNNSNNNSNNLKVKIIEPLENSLLTNEIKLPINKAKQKLENNEINRIYVLERHKNTNNIGKGLIKFLKKGTIISSYAHDSHNVIAIGNNIKDIVLGVNYLKDIGGGFVAVDNGKIIGSVKLNIGGIIGDNGEEIYENMEKLKNKTKNWSVVKCDDIFLTASFLSLSVIPQLKITDFGLIKNNNVVNLVE